MANPISPSDELEVPARFAVIPSTAAFARAFCDRHGVARTAAVRLRLIIEELFTNTIQHGYRGECDKPIRMALALEGAELTLQYEDWAPEYDPRAQWSRPPASLDQPVETRPLGGIGVYLVGQLVSGARYVREEGRNRLWLTLQR